MRIFTPVFIILFLALSLGVSASFNDNMTQGLVEYFNLDDGNLNGNLGNYDFTDNNLGSVSEGFYPIGSWNYMIDISTAGDSVSYWFEHDLNDNASICMWINFTDYSLNATIFEYRNAVDYLTAKIIDGSIILKQEEFAFASYPMTEYSANEYHHFCFMRHDKAYYDSLEIVIDGEIKDYQTGVGFSKEASSDPFDFGQGVLDVANNMNFTIDEIAIYDTVLSYPERRCLYNGGVGRFYDDFSSCYFIEREGFGAGHFYPVIESQGNDGDWTPEGTFVGQQQYSGNSLDIGGGYQFVENITLTGILMTYYRSSGCCKYYIVENWDGDSWVKIPVTSWNRGSWAYNTDEIEVNCSQDYGFLGTGGEGYVSVGFEPISINRTQIRCLGNDGAGDYGFGIQELEFYYSSPVPDLSCPNYINNISCPLNHSGTYYLNYSRQYFITDDPFEIQSSNVVLDCNGSTIYCNNTDFGCISVGGNPDVEIKNCILINYEEDTSGVGILFGNSSDTEDNLKISDNYFEGFSAGIWTDSNFFVTNVQVIDNIFIDCDDPIYSDENYPSGIEDWTIDGNVMTGFTRFELRMSAQSSPYDFEFLNNILVSNGEADIIFQGLDGASISDYFINNSVTCSGCQYCVQFLDASDMYLRDNILRGCSVGFFYQEGGNNESYFSYNNTAYVSNCSLFSFYGGMNPAESSGDVCISTYNPISCVYSKTPTLRLNVPYVRDSRMDWLCSVNISDASCYTYVKKDDVVVQVNPDPKSVSEIGSVSSYQGISTVTGSVVRVSFSNKNLVPENEFQFYVVCSNNNETLTVNASVIPDYNQIKGLGSRMIWLKDSVPYIIGLTLILIIGGSIWFLIKSR